MLRIIDNKRIDLTDSEWELYQKICTSYDVERRGIQGKDLFTDLFETDKSGIITFLKPPKNLTSMEVYMFLISVMVHQHLGVACTHIDVLVDRLDKKNIQLDDKIKQLNSFLERAEKILYEIDLCRDPKGRIIPTFGRVDERENRK